ncbi:MAG TPA: xanthine dehydrogenase family protein subunit M [Candidatus Acidoferrales bacterium]|jgi:carbon-monoxide dehydrogenase medium subunit|nr:xanthine dehydrogenase family protein subunit M [Candidatus Acidoferrales bacterium]
MIPSAFDYHAPKTLEEALRLLERHGDEAKLLAGGHSLLPLMKLRLASPRFVIDIGKLRGMSYVREEEGIIAIGALTTHAEVAASELLAQKCPLLSETAGEIGDVQVRNRGTIGGSLAHADPAADYPASILALDAEIVSATSGGARTIAARDFFVDMLTTALRHGEILTQVRMPIQKGRAGAAYKKLYQPASGFAIVGVAARLSLSASGKIESVAVGVTGLGPKAYRAEAAEKALVGKKPGEKEIASAAKLAPRGIEPLGDLHASADYRREMAIVFTRRALEAAAARASGKAK